MRLVTFSDARGARIGRLEGERVVDLAAAAPELPRELRALLAAGPLALGRASSASGPSLPLAGLRLEAPIPRPGKILAVGLNYRAHAAETGREPPPFPVIFNKQTTSVVGPADPIHRPRASEQLDYEGELGFVIGTRVPPRAARPRRRGDRRLRRGERRERPRLAGTQPDHDDGQVLRHALPVRPRARHARRDRRPARIAAPHLGERRAAPGRLDEGS